MSTSSAFYSDISDQIIYNYNAFSAFIIYTLHYIQTLPIELRSIWSTRFTGTSVLFLLNRHGFMLFQILNTIGDFPGNIGQFPCTALEFTTSSLNVVTSFSTSMLLLLRVYAIYGLNRLILAVGLVFIIPVAALNIYISTGLVPETASGSIFSKFTTCFAGVNTIRFESTMMLVIQLLPLASETWLLSLMLYKLAGVIRTMRRVGQKSFLEVLQRDGLLCYATILAVSLAQVIPILTHGSNPTLEWVLGNVVSPYFSVLQTIVINLMFLNLRSPDSCTQGQDMDGTASSLPEINFVQNKFIGNIGAPVESGGQWNADSEDLEPEEDAVSNKDGFAATSSRAQNATTNLVPVAYDDNEHGDDGEIRFVPLTGAAHITASIIPLPPASNV